MEYSTFTYRAKKGLIDTATKTAEEKGINLEQYINNLIEADIHSSNKFEARRKDTYYENQHILVGLNARIAELIMENMKLKNQLENLIKIVKSNGDDSIDLNLEVITESISGITKIKE